jgi:Flp pilus assembly protein protease CpaA
MQNGPFFYPDPVFGWTFYAVLLGFLAVATYTDIRSLTIPKTLTLSMLAVGLVFGVVRGIWMGSVLQANESSLVVWHFARTPALGALDGLLCSLEGILAAFAVFFVLWLIGLMKGGDLKLVTALGAWVGPIIVGLVVLGSIPVLLVLGTVLLIRKVFRRGVQKTVFNVAGKAHVENIKHGRKGPKQRAEIWLAYSLPVAISAALLLGYLVVHDQQHPVPAKAPAPAQQASTQR